ncbi:hypothetical protein YC2023_122008 [Brassica napus]
MNNFSGHKKASTDYQQWEDNLKIWYHRHQLSDDEEDDDPADTWKDFRLEMRRLVEESERETAVQYHQPQRNDTHAVHTSTPCFRAKSKEADHTHNPQKVEPAKEKPTIKQSKSSQPSSLQLPKEPVIRPRSKGDSEPTQSKATVVHIQGSPRLEVEAMAQGFTATNCITVLSIAKSIQRSSSRESYRSCSLSLSNPSLFFITGDLTG